MATHEAINSLHESLQKLAATDWEPIRRPGLGDESLSTDLKPFEEKITRIHDLAKMYSFSVHDDTVAEIRNTIESILNILNQQANYDNASYLQTKHDFIQTLENQIEEANRWKPMIAGAAILDRGLLDIEDLRAEIGRAQNDLRKTAEKTLKEIEAESENVIKAAEARSNAITSRARQTAAGISIEEAQKQFRGTEDHDRKQVRLWTGLAVVSVAVLIVCAASFMPSQTSPVSLSWPSLLPSALIKVFILSTIAGTATFSFRMLRAHLHIAEKNRHRVRVANSVASFVESAADKSQRDLILSKLADAIVNYGDSGLVQHERDDHSATMSGDVIGRIVAAISGKGSS